MSGVGIPRWPGGTLNDTRDGVGYTRKQATLATELSSNNKSLGETKLDKACYSLIKRAYNSPSHYSSLLFHQIPQFFKMGSAGRITDLKITSESLAGSLHESCQFGAAHRYGK